MADTLRTRAHLRELVEGYALAVDRGDADAAALLFTPYGELVLFMNPASGEPTGLRRGRDEIRAALGQLAAYQSTHHAISATRSEVHGLDATGETSCVAHHFTAERDHVLYIRYLDGFSRGQDGEWRFQRRELHVLDVMDIERSRP